MRSQTSVYSHSIRCKRNLYTNNQILNDNDLRSLQKVEASVVARNFFNFLYSDGDVLLPKKKWSILTHMQTS